MQYLNTTAQEKFHRSAWAVLAFNLGVIVWGAYVRASGSGAGCGSHWPLCNGELLPHAPRVQTLVEFAHRLTSGVCLIASVAMAFWARRVFAKAHPARWAAFASVFFMFMEAWIGAALVLLGHVATNQSSGRAVSISLHLANTLFLLASLLLTAQWSAPGRLRKAVQLPGPMVTSMGLATLAMVFLGISGAITALGDTLFHSASLASGMRQDFVLGSHFLLKLRVIHPVLAFGVGFALCLFAELCRNANPSPQVARSARLLQAAVGFQLVLGATNLALMAPIPLQLLHLFCADLVWLGLISLCAGTLGAEATRASTQVVGPLDHDVRDPDLCQYIHE